MNSKYLLALNAHPKIGSQTLKKISSAYDNADILWNTSESNLSCRLGEKIAKLIVEARTKYDPEEEIDKLARYGVGYITISDKNFPKALKEVYDCPVILYIKGDLEVLNSVMLGVVGSRKYSDYGKNYSYKIARECAEAGVTIVSGLALGIDAFAHQATVDCMGKTIGVLGCGLDAIYPISNFHLGQKIIQNGGAIISEFPIGTPPMKQNFPARNRIIAGLSAGVFVVEAAERSGALITAYQAIEYNRDVFALPGDINRETSAGTNKLLQEGAKLVTCSEDILIELNVKMRSSVKKILEIIPENDDEKKIIDLLRLDEMAVSEIIAKSGLNIVAVNTALTFLEMKGIVLNRGGGRYCLNN